MTEQDSRLRVAVIGGTGYFGGKLIQLLADEPRLTLIVGSRTLAKAQAACARIAARAELIPAALERNTDLEARLRALNPDIVVDASGPFQAYGRGDGLDRYHVARVAIALGAHYLDLADASDFVAGIVELDAAARARGVVVLSGVSSFPVLTAAVVRHLSAGMGTVEAITAGIAPSPHADVGLNVIQAIAGYAGKPVRLVRDGRPAIGHGLTEARRMTICPPGALPLGNIRFSLVDVPDLRVLPPLWPQARDIWMGAGPVPEILHRMLNGMAWLVRLRLLPTLSPLAPLFLRVLGLARWGAHRGGMLVRVDGVRPDGVRIARSWHLLAEGDDGPLIPSMAVEGIVRHMLAGRPPPPGARAATGELELADYDRLFQRRTIRWGVREELGRTPTLRPIPLYAHILGSAWDRLPEPIRRLHDIGPGQTATAAGTATIERGTSPPARLIAAVFGFPAAGIGVPVRVRFDVEQRPDGKTRETWTRTFGVKRFRSVQWAGAGRSEHLVNERFGPFTFGLAVVLDGDRLRLVPRRWSCLGLPLPRVLMASGDSHERVEDGRFFFHVEIRGPLAGLIVRYQGDLTPTLPVPPVA